jgi:hypothetical protein
MTPRSARVVLWVAALAVVPVPLLVAGRGWLPPAAVAELAGATFAVGVAERADDIIRLLGGILLGQAGMWAVVAWFAASVAARVLHRVAPRRVGAATLAVVLVAVAVTAAVPVYSSPFHATRSRQTLLEVYR